MHTVLMAFLGSLGSGLTFNVKGRKLIFAGISGAAGWLVYLFFHSISGSSVFSTFAGAMAVGFYSETAARLLKSPSTVFSIPGILPLVPGITAYEMIQAITENDMANAMVKMANTVGGAGAIAFGILLVTAVFRRISKKKKDKAAENTQRL